MKKGQEEFAQIYKKDPSIFYLNICKRIPDIVLPGLPWIFYISSPYGVDLNTYKKLKVALSSWNMFLDFLIRHVYIRLFLFLGYVGILYALFWKHYFGVYYLSLCGGGGLGKLPSHIEYRYIVPYYFVFSFFVGYLAVYLNSLF